MSDWLSLGSGVPQGSVLAPLLFNIYINDLPAAINVANPRQKDWTKDPVQSPMFADDIALYPNPYSTPYSSATQMKTNLQDGLDQLTTWAEKWKVTFSMEKTKLVVFQRQHVPMRPYANLHNQFILCGQPIEQVHSYKYLGVHMQHNLRWQTHETAILKKIRYSSHLISRLCAGNSSVRATTIRLISNAIILAQISYGLAFWRPSKTGLRKMISLYLQPMRRALHLPYTTHRDAIMVEAGLTPLEFRQEQLARQTFNRVIHRAQQHPTRKLLTDIMRRQRALPRKTLSALHQQLWPGVRDINQVPPPESNEDLRNAIHDRLVEKLRTTEDGSSLRIILQWNDGSMHIPQRGMSAYIYEDDRTTASARALLRFDRLRLPSVRRRIYQHDIEPLCSFPACEQAGLHGTRIHVLTECHQFNDARQQCLARLAELDPTLSFNTMPVDLALGEVHQVHDVPTRKAVLAATGKFVKAIYTTLQPSAVAESTV
jgi:hypothetical protein